MEKLDGLIGGQIQVDRAHTSGHLMLLLSSSVASAHIEAIAALCACSDLWLCRLQVKADPQIEVNLLPRVHFFDAIAKRCKCTLVMDIFGALCVLN